jgi:hypothetical protein
MDSPFPAFFEAEKTDLLLDLAEKGILGYFRLVAKRADSCAKVHSHASKARIRPEMKLGSVSKTADR